MGWTSVISGSGDSNRKQATPRQTFAARNRPVADCTGGGCNSWATQTSLIKCHRHDNYKKNLQQAPNPHGRLWNRSIQSGKAGFRRRWGRTPSLPWSVGRAPKHRDNPDHRDPGAVTKCRIISQESRRLASRFIRPPTIPSNAIPSRHPGTRARCGASRATARAQADIPHESACNNRFRSEERVSQADEVLGQAMRG